ncbi:hypothetical protein J5N97_006298 [Dioscorea zingiberensis]|uniref:Uncharacterized protein n=1 Tax=Dioscorea zingiberensis TaxID=325984 RepID=A0A9D5DC45_9LILI|nr:hypothetical protein J5N97_006298 [Dioscorea zingiberensis]
MGLRKFVEAGTTSYQDMEILDRTMISNIEADEVTSYGIMRINECLVSVLKVGLACSDPTTRGRLNMTDAATKMHTIRNAYLMDEEIESDEEFNDQLVRERELEMENMWNANLDWEENTKGDEEDMIDLIRDSQSESPLKMTPLEEKGDDTQALNDPKDTNKASNEPPRNQIRLIAPDQIGMKTKKSLAQSS